MDFRPPQVVVGEDEQYDPIYYKNMSTEIKEDMTRGMDKVNKLFAEYEELFPYQSQERFQEIVKTKDHTDMQKFLHKDFHKIEQKLTSNIRRCEELLEPVTSSNINIDPEQIKTLEDLQNGLKDSLDHV